ncbi:hypothetical protein Lalb_Chr10g0094971 [Lupinus albus]|uniref:Uncharacterized protein n=1 Tax=Lupinus albus TaxID=3870 RepID=A0A6A4PV94_LUPAL|nr:hypothetical protein Lalb_Chr10g0094971 [Lupinus albus]
MKTAAASTYSDGLAMNQVTRSRMVSWHGFLGHGQQRLSFLSQIHSVIAINGSIN